MAISRPPAKPWGDPAEAVRSLVRQLAATGEPDADEGVGADAGGPAGGGAVTVAGGGGWGPPAGPRPPAGGTHRPARGAGRSRLLLPESPRGGGTARGASGRQPAY